jgi:Eco57I restriction-modification methylase
MITGFSGHLIAEQFLEQQIANLSRRNQTSGFVAGYRKCRDAQRLMGPASTVRTLLESAATPIVELLGFRHVGEVEFLEDAAVATLRADGVVVALIVTRWGARLDPWWRVAVVEGRRRGASWCLVFNGTHIRLLNAARVFSRRFAEFDLDSVADDDMTASAMHMLVAADVLTRRTPSRDDSHVDVLLALSERHASDVCQSLRTGVLETSEHVLRALVARPHRQSIADVFEQALTIVYRMLFLFFAEGRSLVPSWHPIYRGSYSLERLAEQAILQTPVGLWDALRAVARLAHAGCRAGDLCVTPFNGRLFAPSRTPLAERRDLDDEAARRSLIALSTRPAADGEGRERIAYRDLGVEQLGAVYETLLDYVPKVRRARTPGTSRTQTIVSLEAGSGVRKATGTFYTPQPIATYLIRQTLQPLVRGAMPEQILNLRVLDPSMGSGAFLVGACAFLGEAYEAALITHTRCHPSDLGPRERASIRRTIAERCLYGVDLNPMAVQLARLSLWLATLASDRPLSFLDHHLQVGDSLLGTWISCLRRPPTDRHRQTEKLPLLEELPVGSTLRDVLPVRFSLASEPNDTPEQVRAKERALAALTHRESPLSKWKRVADLWCARWFDSELRLRASLFPTLSDAILSGQCALPHERADHFLRIAEVSAAAHRFFHWELEFPEVFFDASGQRKPDAGFDAVVGNPPWDMVRADRDTPDRARSREETASVVRFTRDAGVYDAQSDGHANRYQLFLERSLALTRPGGRVGLVLPAGLMADQGSARLRRWLFSRCNVDALVGFDNKQAIFPIHRSVRFLLLTSTSGAATTSIACRFGEVDPAILEPCDDNERQPWYSVRLSPDLLQRLSGGDLSVPDVRAPVDLAIAERAAALFRPLGDNSGWAARFGRELNVTDDRGVLRDAGHGLPVAEGKLVEPYRVRLSDARFSISNRNAGRLLGERHQHWRLAYRDVASATNRLTLIASLLPPGSVSTHTVFCLRTPLPLAAQRFLCGMFNSLVVNYFVRLRVMTHVTTTIVERLPIPLEDEAGAAYEEVGSIARALSQRSDPMLEARLNALVATVYQLTREEFTHVLGTFPLIPKEDRDRALDQFIRLGRM